MHLQAGDAHEKTWPAEIIVFLMFPQQDMAHILAQETLDALAKLLYAVGFRLGKFNSA
jgi:hypothetical protein